jgi:hypothetical protein
MLTYDHTYLERLFGPFLTHSITHARTICTALVCKLIFTQIEVCSNAIHSITYSQCIPTYLIQTMHHLPKNRLILFKVPLWVKNDPPRRSRYQHISRRTSVKHDVKDDQIRRKKTANIEFASSRTYSAMRTSGFCRSFTLNVFRISILCSCSDFQHKFSCTS